MKKELRKTKATIGIILLWIVVFIACYLTPLYGLLEGFGIESIDGEWYRLFSGWVLHYNLFHLLVNVLGYYYAASYLEECIGSTQVFVFSLVIACVSEAAVSCLIYRQGGDMIGGSILVFGCLGMILAIHLFFDSYRKIRLKSRRGEWLIGYAVLGNCPLIPMVEVGTIVLHTVSAGLGFVVGFVWLKYLER